MMSDSSASPLQSSSIIEPSVNVVYRPNHIVSRSPANSNTHTSISFSSLPFLLVVFAQPQRVSPAEYPSQRLVSVDVADKVYGGAEQLLGSVAARGVVLGGLKHHDRLPIDTQPNLEEAEDVAAALGQRGKVGVEVSVARVAGLQK